MAGRSSAVAWALKGHGRGDRAGKFNESLDLQRRSRDAYEGRDRGACDSDGACRIRHFGSRWSRWRLCADGRCDQDRKAGNGHKFEFIDNTLEEFANSRGSLDQPPKVAT